MKIYTKLVIDLVTNTVTESEWFDYSGPLAMAKGGGGSSGSQTTTVQPSKQQESMQELGLNYVRPSMEGQSFQPLTGVRDLTWGKLEPQIPILERQTQQLSNLPSRMAAFQPIPSPQLQTAQGMITGASPNLAGAYGATQAGAAPTQQEFLAQQFMQGGANIPGGQAAQGLAFQGANPTTQERLAQLFAIGGSNVPGGPAAQGLAFSGASPTTQEQLAQMFATGATSPNLDVARAAALTNLGNQPTTAMSAAQAELANRMGTDPTLYNSLADRMLLKLRPGLAARGVATSGVGQQAESEALEQLNIDLALQEAAQRQAAISQVGGLEQQQQANRTTQIGQLGNIESGSSGRLATAAGQLGNLGQVEAARRISAAQAAGGLGGLMSERLLNTSGQLGNLGGQEATRRIAGAQAASGIGGSMAQQLLQAGGQLGVLGQQQAGRQLTAGGQLGQLSLGQAASELQRANAMSNLPITQEQLNASQLQRQIAQSQAEAQLVKEAQQGMTRGFQAPLDVLQSAVATEAAPMELLTRLLGASSGGTQISTGSMRNTGGGGIFGK